MCPTMDLLRRVIMDDSEERLARDFPGSYVPPVQAAEIYDDTWERTIEIKLSRQGQIIMIVGAVAAAGFIMTLLQGKVVINLMKSQGQIVEGLNSLSSTAPVTTQEPPKGRHIRPTASEPINLDAKPSTTVDYGKPERPTLDLPVDDQLLADLQDSMKAAEVETDLQSKSKEI